MGKTGDDEAKLDCRFLIKICFCRHYRRYATAISSFLIKFCLLHWDLGLACHDHPLEMKLVILSSMPHSLDEIENRVHVGAKTYKNKSVWTLPLCAKWDGEIKSAVDSWVYQQSHCPWRGLLLLDLSTACGHVCLSWKDISLYNWDGRVGTQALMSYFKAIS